MKKILIALFIFLFHFSYSQTYTSTAGGSIPDAGPQVQFPMTVSGLSPSMIDTVFGLETVCITITHTWDSDLSISLQSPDGSIVDLSVANGADGDGYTSTCFNGFAANSVVTGTAPFTGTYRPQGFMGILNNGQVGNGTWKLLVQDNAGADTGSVINWSITFGNAPAKPFNFISSNLPIVVINTGGPAIPDSPKMAAHMGIIYNGAGIRNHMTDPFNNYNDSVGIELRGSSSLGFPQKSYGFETWDSTGIKKDTMLLGMPTEHDWILYAPFDDKTCMRNVLTYDIANKTGHYASRTRFCELMVNGQYQGIYVLMEKIKHDANRVNLAGLQPIDTSGDALTGGYIIKVDRDDGPGSYWTSVFPSSAGNPINYVFVYPKNGVIVPQQRNYIQSYVDTCEAVLNGTGFADPVNGYRKYFGVGSFIDYFILNELSKNVDGYRLSTFFYKDKQSKGGKLKAGPAWDYNLGWWNANYCQADITSGWAYQLNDICSGYYDVPFWWNRLLQDPSYTAQLKCRWTELRQSVLSILALNTYVDSLALYLDEAQVRHFTAWPILGQYTWPNPSPIPADYAGEITAIKQWMLDRIVWLDANMPGSCNVGINENALSENNLSVYPNPFSNLLQVHFYLAHADEISMEITDMIGKKVKTIERKMFPEGDNEAVINLSEDEAMPGIYFLKMSSNEGTVVKKIVRTN